MMTSSSSVENEIRDCLVEISIKVY